MASLLLALPVAGRVVDDFNDNTKTGWQDFTFIPGVGLAAEENGQFRFTIPAVGQSIFTGAIKTTQSFTVQDGRTVELRVDLVTGNGGDSFAVLFFLPDGQPISALKGYGFAKSTTDILITKGINKYFVAETSGLKNDNVTLVMSLTGKGTSVVINAKVLDKDAGDAVIWERTVVDTAGADILDDGADDPAAPYTGKGSFGLLCYEDNGKTQASYEVIYDNAEAYVTDTTLVDDFNDNTKTAWQDFTFIPGVGLAVEENAQFRFTIPAVGQSIFTGATKTTLPLQVADGERLEMGVDLVTGNGGDSFAVLFFLPDGQQISALKGYGFAKSTTDILITKGINKYFVAETAGLKNDNVRLVLTLTGKGTSVIINAKVLDMDADNAVIWERTVVDTAGADILDDGADDPPEPYTGKGKFGLLCYEDNGKTQASYEVIYDNATVAMPPAAGNTPPIISEVSPAASPNFLPASTVVSFKVLDDKAVPASGLSVTLNGTVYTTANGLQVSGAGTTVTATLGGLAANVNYTGLIKAVDSDAVTSTASVNFDTFDTGLLTVEVEDYNYAAGQFMDNPVVLGYGNLAAVMDTDYSDTRTTPDIRYTEYRPEDTIQMAHSLDVERKKFTDAGGAAGGVYDYDVGDIVAGEWLNYTRTFPPGSYEVYLREALANVAQNEVLLQQVTSDPSQADQQTKNLGAFLGAQSGFEYRNVPLTDAVKKKVILRLSGATTLRLAQNTTDPNDGAVLQTYFIFVPVPDPGIQRAAITSVSPADGATVATVAPSLSVTIQNKDTSVRAGSINLFLNGAQVTPTVTSDANGAVVTYAITPLPAAGSVQQVRLAFTDNLNVTQTSEWSFTLAYKTLDAANAEPGPGIGRGFDVRMVQAPQGSGLDNSLARAEEQLRPNSSIPAWIVANEHADVVYYDKRDEAGQFGPYNMVPGLDPGNNGDQDFAVEILAYLSLPAGPLRFGVHTDDGYKITSGAVITDPNAPLLAFHNGGPANEVFDFIVPRAGLYPFRMVWYERGGAAYAEWFSEDPVSHERTLINDPANPGAIKAYRSVTPQPAFKLESAARLGDAFTQDAAGVLDATAHTFTVPIPAGQTRFYRLNARTGQRITAISVVGNRLVLTFASAP